jgi:hypothetical protein
VCSITGQLISRFEFPAPRLAISHQSSIVKLANTKLEIVGMKQDHISIGVDLHLAWGATLVVAVTAWCRDTLW